MSPGDKSDWSGKPREGRNSLQSSGEPAVRFCVGEPEGWGGILGST